MPRLTQIMGDLGLGKLRYDLTEDKFMENEINDPFVGNFLYNFDDLFGQYKVTIPFVDYESHRPR